MKIDETGNTELKKYTNIQQLRIFQSLCVYSYSQARMILRPLKMRYSQQSNTTKTFWKTIMLSVASVGAFSLYDSQGGTGRGSTRSRSQSQTQKHEISKTGKGAFFSRPSFLLQIPIFTLSHTGHSSNPLSSKYQAFMAPKSALCAQASPEHEDNTSESGSESESAFDVNSLGGGDPSSYYFEKMREPSRNFSESHAIFGALRKPGHVERYITYRRVPVPNSLDDTSKNENGVVSVDTTSSEVCVSDIRIGEQLNGHNGIVHGGIISLMLDDAFGWGYEAMCLIQGFTYDDAHNGDLPFVVTANLSVNYRAPLPAGSNAVIRVRHEKTDGRKIYFSSRMESHDGSVLYSEATALFITVKKEYLKDQSSQ